MQLDGEQRPMDEGSVDEHLQQALESPHPKEKNYHVRQALQLLVVDEE